MIFAMQCPFTCRCVKHVHRYSFILVRASQAKYQRNWASSVPFIRSVSPGTLSQVTRTPSLLTTWYSLFTTSIYSDWAASGKGWPAYLRLLLLLLLLLGICSLYSVFYVYRAISRSSGVDRYSSYSTTEKKESTSWRILPSPRPFPSYMCIIKHNLVISSHTW